MCFFISAFFYTGSPEDQDCSDPFASIGFPLGRIYKKSDVALSKKMFPSSLWREKPRVKKGFLL